jgi:hypothetical protein
VAAPVLATNLISAFPTTTDLDCHYLTPALPALIVGALDGGGWLAKAIGRRTRRDSAGASAGASKGSAERALCWAMLAAILVAYVLASRMPGSLNFPIDRYRPDEDTEAIAAMLAQVPGEVGVQGPDALLPHLAERQSVRRGPPPDANEDWVILDASHRRRYAQREDLLRTTEEPTVRDWLARPSYGLLATGGPYLLLRRGLDPRESLGMRARVGEADPESGQRIAACLAIRGARVEGDRLLLELVARGPCPADLAIHIGTSRRPRRTDLLFDGLLSPAHLRRGDLLLSEHSLRAADRRRFQERGLRVGALRSSGARPEHEDPVSVAVPISDPEGPGAEE